MTLTRTTAIVPPRRPDLGTSTLTEVVRPGDLVVVLDPAPAAPGTCLGALQMWVEVTEAGPSPTSPTWWRLTLRTADGRELTVEQHPLATVLALHG